VRKFAWQGWLMTGQWETGRSADVGPLLDNVTSWEDVAEVLAAMQTDLAANPEAWENNTLDRYLDALAALFGSVESLHANRGEEAPDQPSWRLVAELLVGATGYE
jgi:hypothetical protein